MPVVKRNFNSTMVRLKEPALLRQAFVRLFQFHYGTIKSWILPYSDDNIVNFNSTMVRLKVGSRCQKSPYLKTFQFHYGTIKRFLNLNA